MSLMDCVDLEKIYRGGKHAVKGVSFHVNEGEIVGLLGPNGAGKSTTFKMACGQHAPTKGRVFLQGRDVTGWPMYQRARLGLGYLPQNESVFAKLSVEQNIIAVLEYLKVAPKERRETTADLLGQFGLTEKRAQAAGTLSGGERRRLEIARCLASKPRIILLDEPFTGIDPVTIHDIQDVIFDLRKQGIAILLTDHRELETLSVTDRNYIICEGRVLCSGDAETVLNDENAKAQYFGNRFDAGSVLAGQNNPPGTAHAA